MAAFDWTIIHKAYALLVAEGRSGMLHGTAALAAHGHDVTPGDIDFLCDSIPLLLGIASKESSEPGKGIATEIDGTTVDFIAVDDESRPFLSRGPSILHGIPVASAQDVLAWKRYADRPKDRDFLRNFPGTPESLPRIGQPVEEDMPW